MSGTSARHAPRTWSPDSWRDVTPAHQFQYPDPVALDRAVARLRTLPPLVTSWEVESLKELIAQAQRGERFLLQGGDCAESIDACTPGEITSKLKILLQMSLVLVHGAHRPVIRLGRFAGQYAKPRSRPTETRSINGADLTLPSYFGDIVNRPDFTTQARTPDPELLLHGFTHSAITLNFIRSLCDAGFADFHHPEYWDLSFMRQAALPADLRAQYESTSRRIADALRFMEALGERSVDALARVEFFTSHEGLNLYYESALTRTVPRREGWYNLSTHLPWIGERTRALDSAHVEYFRGIQNPIGLKLGPNTDAAELLRLIDTLNPANEPGKIVLITRMGAGHVASRLPPLVDIVASARKLVLWVCDPMHANGMKTASGVKTRSFDAILDELERTCEIHAASGRPLGGVHFELTGQDVTECLGGSAGVSEADLHVNYASACDPRLNYQQSLEMAFLLARTLGRGA